MTLELRFMIGLCEVCGRFEQSELIGISWEIYYQGGGRIGNDLDGENAV
jgi:hypothetical protein